MLVERLGSFEILDKQGDAEMYRQLFIAEASQRDLT
jgi:hypothetical protein